MGTSRHKPKRCETCVFYKPSDMKGQGWCTHPKRQQTGGMLLLVRAGALDCRNSWGEDFWTPLDDSSAAAAAQTAAPQASEPNATATPAAPIEDLVVRQDSIMHDDLATAYAEQRDDESINHAALSDQEERAQVIARGAREAIRRARERRKEQIAHSRQPGVAALPSTHATTDDPTRVGEHDEDVVLQSQHQYIDPFRRSYGDPAPPVPSREMPADSGGIVTRDRDDRFDTVPEVRNEVELPRPASYSANGVQETNPDDDIGDATALPDDPALTTYDRVLQRARDFQLRSGTRTPRRAIRQRAPSPTPAHAAPAEYDCPESAMRSQATDIAARPGNSSREPDQTAYGPIEDAMDDGSGWTDASSFATPDDVAMPDWDDDPDAPWRAVESLIITRPPTRSRFRLPQLSFFRPTSHPRLAAASLRPADEDEVVDEVAWPAGERQEPVAPALVDDDPDWVEEMMPVERYVANQPERAPADVSPDAHVETTWDDQWADEPVEDERFANEAAGYQPFEVRAPVEPESESMGDDREVGVLSDDRITSESTVPHRPQPAPASFDLVNLRARLFAREYARDDDQPERVSTMTAYERGPFPRADDRWPASIHATTTEPPDDDPDPEPGSGFDATLPGIDGHWSEPEPEFDIRAVVQRQDELLDMRIQVAPDVPRACRTCRSFRLAEGGERGWCTNEWAFSHRRMVNADDLPCESSIGCWWLPADDVWLPGGDLEALTQPTPLVDRLLGRLTLPTVRDVEEEPRHARAR